MFSGFFFAFIILNVSLQFSDIFWFIFFWGGGEKTLTLLASTSPY